MVLSHNELWARPKKNIMNQSYEKSTILLKRLWKLPTQVFCLPWNNTIKGSRSGYQQTQSVCVFQRQNFKNGQIWPEHDIRAQRVCQALVFSKESINELRNIWVVNQDILRICWRLVNKQT